MSHQYKVFWYRVPRPCIGGPYAAIVRRIADDKTVSSCSGIRDQISAAKRASEYGWSFAVDRIQAPIERVYCPGQSPEMSHTEALNAAFNMEYTS